MNAILYGLSENNEKSTQYLIVDLVNKECFKQIKCPVKAVRLGQKVEGKNRPIKLEFTDEHWKWEFLKRANAMLKGDRIYCKLDVSKEVRDQEFAMREKLRKLRKNNPSSEYRIRDGQAQTKSEQGEWIALNRGKTENKATDV